MTEREQRNEEVKARIRQHADDACMFIDLMEQELKLRERMNQELANEVDRLRNGVHRTLRQPVGV